MQHYGLYRKSDPQYHAGVFRPSTGAAINGYNITLRNAPHGSGVRLSVRVARSMPGLLLRLPFLLLSRLRREPK
jgi:hypothetical protein